jgi:TetR/AcrR family acrAB operon transcriptional repressor
MARRTKEEAQATRSHILDTAELVFEQRGVSGTSLHEIAKAAGVTRGAIYWHFADKQALVAAIREDVT